MVKGKPKKKRPSKVPDLLGRARKCIESDRYYDTRHAQIRRSERAITLPEIVMVIETGYWEKSKDDFREEFQAWNYAVRGKTIDGRDLRIVVSFDRNCLILITAIDLGT